MARLVTETAMRRFLERVPDYHLTETWLEFVVEFPQPDSAAVRTKLALGFGGAALPDPSRLM